jgi:DeoR/GlpR family transcriptional regulator of sugar metabolism
MIGASGFSVDGVSETVRGFAAVKREMIRCANLRQLLVASDKFGKVGLARVAELDVLDTVFVDALPDTGLHDALISSGVTVSLA